MEHLKLLPIALALHSGLAMLCAQSTVTLAPVASPSAAQPSVTTVTLIGSGFPGGTILPQDLLVTLAVAAQPGAPSGPAPAVFAASAVQSLFGSSERVTFTIPAGTFIVSSPTPCQVSIAGQTTAQAAFTSGNTASLTVNPLPTVSVAPNTGNAGQSQQVTITGLYTNFLQGSTVASFGPYVSVGGAAYGQPGPVAVASATTATAQLAISPSAAPGPQLVQIATGSQTTASESFTINAALAITTNSPLPTGTVGVNYSATLMASGGSGTYTWSVSSGSLPGGLTLASATGAITGQPTTAATANFTIQVTDSTHATASNAFTMTIDPALAITTNSPLPTGTVGVNYAATLMASGGSGTYAWAVSAGSLPTGLSLAAATGVISGQPTTEGAPNFTIEVTDSTHATASKAFTMTIDPAPLILTVTPDTGNAGLSLLVTITGANTHFVQGTTQASFGPGVSVGGAASGAFGPVTVNSLSSATAEVSIDASAATGSQTVTVVTGAEQASLANGFTIQAAIPYISLTTTSTTPLAPGFSGFNDEYLIDGIEYWDPKWLAMVAPLKPGWIRFPSGTASMAFDWETGHMNTGWISIVEPYLSSNLIMGLVTAQEMTQAKGGACFSGGACGSDYATFLKTLGANGIVALNGFTDNIQNSDGNMAVAAQAAGISIIEWEIDNEPYDFPLIFPTPASYAAFAYNPYYLHLHGTDPNATAGVFFQGQFLTLFGDYQAWDSGMAAYSPQYWQGVSFHVYPVTETSISASDEEQTLNGILAHGTTEYYSSYIQPLVGQNTPVFFSEINSGPGYPPLPFESYIYNGIFLAEWVARMSTIPQVQAVGVSALFLPNYFSQGMICAVNDYEDYLVAEVQANPNYSTDTATNPNTQYSFYYSASGLAMEVANPAINSSTATWPTTVTGGPTVPIEGYDGNPVPAVFAQGYQGAGGTHYLLITNKSGSSIPMAIVVDGNVLPSNVTVSYISSANDTAQNTAAAQNTVQIVTATSANPIAIGPYSVTRVQW